VLNIADILSLVVARKSRLGSPDVPIQTSNQRGGPSERTNRMLDIEPDGLRANEFPAGCGEFARSRPIKLRARNFLLLNDGGRDATWPRVRQSAARKCVVHTHRRFEDICWTNSFRPRGSRRADPSGYDLTLDKMSAATGCGDMQCRPRIEPVKFAAQTGLVSNHRLADISMKLVKTRCRTEQ